jgi:glutamine synthetase
VKTKNEILSEVKENNIEMIRFIYTDNDGVVRGYVTMADELEGDLETGHPFAIAMPFFSVLDDLTPGTQFGCVGEVSGVPDLQTFRILPHVTNTGMVICDFLNKFDHRSSGLCARSLLKEYLSSLDCRVYAAFENEFYLLTKDDDGCYTPFDDSLCFATSGMNLHHEIVHQIIQGLNKMGMKVEKYYPEYGRGQVEIVYKYDHALCAADNQIFFRETVKGIAQQHGLIASFMPKPFNHLAGSGAHLHLSLFKDGENLFYDPKNKYGLSEMARHFIGGVLKHLKAICAFTASTVNSYKRLLPHHWASAYTCYGFDNREAAVRVITVMKGRDAASFNIEIKPVDAACNPYLAILSTLAAGMDGIKNRLDPGNPLFSDPHDMSDSERLDLGISRLPETLKDAVNALSADLFFKDVLGEVFYSEYTMLKKFAWNQYNEQVTSWELEKYAEAF